MSNLKDIMELEFNIKGIDPEVAGCVYKLFYGPRYLIVKGRTLAGSIYLIQKGYAYFMAGGGGSGHKGGATGEGHDVLSSKNTYYFKFYSYLYDNPGLELRAEVIYESENPYSLLKREHQELQASMRDKKCLNNNVEAYIPKFRKSTRSYGWISIGHVLAFKKFLKAT